MLDKVSGYRKILNYGIEDKISFLKSYLWMICLCKDYKRVRIVRKIIIIMASPKCYKFNSITLEKQRQRTFLMAIKV
jgi:hypothetical protein